jgi:hypothetical protein
MEIKGGGASSYSIFVSHTSSDKNLAQAVTRVIEEAFGGRIELYLAVEDIVGGARWKEDLKKNIKKCDAVISIMTRESINKPWLYIEWAPFWLAEKKFYVLVSDQADTAALVDPMSDTQAVHIQDESSVEKFFRALREDAKLPAAHPVPSDRVPVFLEAVSAAMRADLAASTDRHADASVELPDSDQEKRKILEYFYEKGDPETFTAIFRRVHDNALKADVALWVSKKGDVELTARLCEDIQAADHLCRVASGLIRAGHADSPGLRHVLDMIQGRNNAELRKLAVELLDRGEDDTDVFRYMIRIMSNMAELRKVGMRLVEKGEHRKPIFNEIVDKISQANRTPLRDVGLEFLRHGVQRSPEFERILDILVTEKPSLAVPILEELKRTDPDMLPPLRARYRETVGADNAALQWLAKELGPESPA